MDFAERMKSSVTNPKHCIWHRIGRKEAIVFSSRLPHVAHIETVVAADLQNALGITRNGPIRIFDRRRGNGSARTPRPVRRERLEYLQSALRSIPGEASDQQRCWGPRAHR